MAFKFVAVFAFVAVVNAGVISGPVYSHAPAATVHYQTAPAVYSEHSAPLAYGEHTVLKSQPIYAKQVDEYDPHPQYKFGYDVQDYASGDSKSQVESRDGDVVKGEYSLIDADGYKRTVQYTSDSKNGFNAVVHREPLGVKSAPVAYAAAPVVKTSYSAPVAYAAPAVYNTPVAYSTAPVVKTSYTSPVASYHH